jgi:hypothetical protein
MRYAFFTGPGDPRPALNAALSSLGKLGKPPADAARWRSVPDFFVATVKASVPLSRRQGIAALALAASRAWSDLAWYAFRLNAETGLHPAGTVG